MLLFHHSRDLVAVKFGEVTPSPNYISEPAFLGAYQWLEKQVGFYPLFLAVGASKMSLGLTGYSGQWRRIDSSWMEKQEDGSFKRRFTYIKAGHYPNYVLFSYEKLGDGIYTDWAAWHLALNSSHNNYQLTKREMQLILKPSWSEARWKKFAQKHPVQFVAPKLALDRADRVWARNQKTQQQLIGMGFSNVKTKRLSTEY